MPQIRDFEAMHAHLLSAVRDEQHWLLLATNKNGQAVMEQLANVLGIVLGDDKFSLGTIAIRNRTELPAFHEVTRLFWLTVPQNHLPRKALQALMFLLGVEADKLPANHNIINIGGTDWDEVGDFIGSLGTDEFVEVGREIAKN